MVSDVNPSFSLTPAAFGAGSTLAAGAAPSRRRPFGAARDGASRRAQRGGLPHLGLPHLGPVDLGRITPRCRRVAMTARQEPEPTIAGPARHIPVLLDRVLEYLAPRDGGIYIDGTYGAGGYAAAILRHAGARVIGIDRDRSAIAGGSAQVEASAGRLTLVEGRFGALDEIAAGLGIDAVDGVVLDLGVSSMQLDTPERGFSFRHDGPLDMRMGSAGASAADVVAAASERDLADIIFNLGEERHSRAVARAIVAARRDKPIVTTGALADIVGRVVHGRPSDIHPATRTFQALRLFVNDELRELASGLAAAERIL